MTEEPTKSVGGHFAKLIFCYKITLLWRGIKINFKRGHGSPVSTAYDHCWLWGGDKKEAREVHNDMLLQCRLTKWLSNSGVALAI